MNKSHEPQIQAFDAAFKLIGLDRAKEILAWRNWKNGGVLGGLPPPTCPDMTEEENEAIKRLWLTLDGSACWMSALHMLRNNQRPS